MPLENIANEDMLLEFTNPPTGIPPAIPPDATPPLVNPGIDTVKIVPTLAPFSKANGKKIGTTGVTITWTLATGGCPFTSATYVFVAGGGTVVPTAVFNKASAQLVLRKGDVGTCGGGWTLIAAPFTAVTCACKVEIVDAGQDKAKAE